MTIITPFSRREILARTGKLSIAGFAALAGIDGLSHAALAQNVSATSRDADILNVALGLEHEAIEAYQLTADSGLLKGAPLNVALLFQSHHRAHRDALVTAIQKLNGKPVEPETRDQYAKELNVAALKTENDALELATKLEHDAANAYISIIPTFTDRSLAKLAGRLVADESMHWTALISTLGKPLPASALTFGA